MAKAKPAPVGDSTHTPRFREVKIKADPNGNRAERRFAAQQAAKAAKKKGNG